MKKLWNAFKIFAPVMPFIFLKNKEKIIIKIGEKNNNVKI